MKIKHYRVMEDETLELINVYDIDINELGHEICFGIRHGLFGIKASEHENIFSMASDSDIEKGLDNVANALNNIANNIKKEK